MNSVAYQRCQDHIPGVDEIGDTVVYLLRRKSSTEIFHGADMHTPPATSAPATGPMRADIQANIRRQRAILRLRASPGDSQNDT